MRVKDRGERELNGRRKEKEGGAGSWGGGRAACADAAKKETQHTLVTPRREKRRAVFYCGVLLCCGRGARERRGNAQRGGGPRKAALLFVFGFVVRAVRERECDSARFLRGAVLRVARAFLIVAGLRRWGGRGSQKGEERGKGGPRRAAGGQKAQRPLPPGCSVCARQRARGGAACAWRRRGKQVEETKGGEERDREREG